MNLTCVSDSGGYFTSRQALKGYERATSARLHAAQKLLATSRRREEESMCLTFFVIGALMSSGGVVNESAVEMLDQFAQSHGIAQHHDGGKIKHEKKRKKKVKSGAEEKRKEGRRGRGTEVYGVEELEGKEDEERREKE